MSHPNTDRDERVRTPRGLAKYIAANWPGYANPVDALEALITERDRQVGAMLPEVISETVLTSVESRDYTFTDRCKRKCVILSVEERDALCRAVRKVGQAQGTIYFADNFSTAAKEVAARYSDRLGLSTDFLEEEIAQALSDAATRMRDRCIETVKEYWQRIQGEDDEGMRELLFGALVVKLENLTLEGREKR